MGRKILFTVIIALLSINGMAQTAGELKVEVLTSSTGGRYTPRNSMAIWVEDESGKFVKTLVAHAEKRKIFLTNWKNSTSKAGAEFNTVDAISSATRNTHDKVSCTWNGKDFNQKLVADGKYKICIELTEINGTGVYSSFIINKGRSAKTVKPANVPSFSDISLVWTPSKAAKKK
ncbi:MAG: DUF2271 domain-containing protein [Bacteroidales bacterium]|nr:DUF2271 domain-containing protein [Bacteroidales bacterium]